MYGWWGFSLIALDLCETLFRAAIVVEKHRVQDVCPRMVRVVINRLFHLDQRFPRFTELPVANAPNEIGDWHCLIDLDGSGCQSDRVPG